MVRMRRSRAFTLIEIVIVLALMASVFTLGLFASMNSYRHYAFYTDRTIVLTAVENARRMAIDNIDQTPHGVHLSSLGATLFSGGSYVPTDPTNTFFPLTVPVSILGTGDIIFEQLSGNTSDASFIISDGTRQITITTNHEGMLTW